MTEISAETKAYREKAVADYDAMIASAQANGGLDGERGRAWLERIKGMRVWAETCEPPVFRPVNELLDEARSKLAANPDDRDAKNQMAFLERIKAGFDEQAAVN